MGTIVIIEFVLIFGGVIAFCSWELYKLRRERKQELEKAARHAEGEQKADPAA
ncbi:MAG: hypothetical protein AAFY02_08975 [Pseudomonadota bacterium]